MNITKAADHIGGGKKIAAGRQTGLPKVGSILEPTMRLNRKPICRSLAILCTTTVLIATSCAPSDPFERMIWQTGFDGDSGVRSVTNMDSVIGPGLPPFQGVEPARWCSTPIYEGPSASSATLAAIRADRATNASTTLSYVARQVERALPAIKKAAPFETGGTVFNTNQKAVAREIVKALGLPRFAYSGNVVACHSALTLVYAGQDFAPPTEFQLNWNAAPRSNQTRCASPFMALTIEPSGDDVYVGWTRTQRDCK